MPIDPAAAYFYLIVLGVLAAMRAILSARRSRRQRFAASPQGPKCHGCGYILFNDALQTCPECGRDRVIDRLDETLVRPPVRPIVEIIGAAVLLVPLTILAGYLIVLFVPQLWRYEGHDYVTGPRGQIEIWSSMRGLGATQHVDGIELIIFGPSGQRTFEVDLNAMTFRRQGPRYSNLPPAPLTQDELITALGTGGNYRYDRAVRGAAQDIVRVIKWVRGGGSPKIVNRVALRGTYLLPHQFLWLPTYAPACVPVWAALTLLASRRLLRPYRDANARYRQSRERLAIEFAAARGSPARA
jgi:hypothetical protein